MRLIKNAYRNYQTDHIRYFGNERGDIGEPAARSDAADLVSKVLGFDIMFALSRLGEKHRHHAEKMQPICRAVRRAREVFILRSARRLPDCRVPTWSNGTFSLLPPWYTAMGPRPNGSEAAGRKGGSASTGTRRLRKRKLSYFGLWSAYTTNRHRIDPCADVCV